MFPAILRELGVLRTYVGELYHEIKERLHHMTQQIDQLKQNVSQLTDVTKSAVALLNGITARIDAAIAAQNAGDTTAVQAANDEIKADIASLGAAVASNTLAATDGSAPATPPATGTSTPTG